MEEEITTSEEKIPIDVNFLCPEQLMMLGLEVNSKVVWVCSTVVPVSPR